VLGVVFQGFYHARGIGQLGRPRAVLRALIGEEFEGWIG
jgi:hypothetical protein